MSGSISSFQSAIQLVSGANLAIFALPHLGQARLAMEAQRWDKELQLAQIKAPDKVIEVLKEASDYQSKWDQLAETNGRIRVVSLIISCVAALYLIWMSVFSDTQADFWTGAIIVLGFVPGLALAARNAEARRLVKEYADKRNLIKVR